MYQKKKKGSKNDDGNQPNLSKSYTESDALSELTIGNGV